MRVGVWGKMGDDYLGGVIREKLYQNILYEKIYFQLKNIEAETTV